MLELLFENIKVYGRYVRTNGLDGLEYWNRVKSFLSRPEQKEGLEKINKIIGNEWTIKIKLSSENPTTNIEEIYEYVHGNNSNQLGIFGEEGDKEKKSLKHEIWEQNHFFLQLIRVPKNSKLDLIKLLQIAYNLGQLSVCLEKGNFSSKAIDYFKSNNLDRLDSYIKLSPEQNKLLESDISITDLITNTNSFILEQMNLIQTGGAGDLEPFYSENVAELTKQNTDYRRVIFTGRNQQFVLMSIEPKDDVEMEVHEDHDQFVRVEEGEGKAIMGDKEYKLVDDSAFIVPAGTKHQIINTSEKEYLKFYTIYSPPEHKDKLVQKSNPNKNKLSDIKKNIIYETETDNDYLTQKILKDELKKMQNEIVQKGGNIYVKKKEIDYKQKYNEYKNKYIVLKKFISKYY